MSLYFCYFSSTEDTKKGVEGIRRAWGRPAGEVDLVNPIWDYTALGQLRLGREESA